MNAPTGIKHDNGKLPMHLLDRHALEQIAAVLQHGADKYAAENWRGGIEYTRLIAATLRHVMAISDGEDTDPESNLPHAAHACCCLMFLMWMMKHRPDLDDRYANTKAMAEITNKPVKFSAPLPAPKTTIVDRIDEAALLKAMVTT